MRFIDALRGLFRKFADHLAARRRLSQFTCSDCERHNRCGEPPSQRCAARQAQIARDDDWVIQRPRSYNTAPY